MTSATGVLEMSFRGRRVLGVVVAACCVLGVAAESGGARGGSSASAGGESAPGGLALRSPAIVAVSSPEEGVQAEAQQARLDSPAAIAARKTSRTKFEHLGAARAAQVARESFPETIDRAVGGPPRLPAGQRIVDYISSNAAQLALPGGRRAVVDSMQPMAIETSRGHRAPIDLSLTRRGGVFESVRPLVSVLIPQRLSAGVKLTDAGVSLTPVDAQGSPLGGSEGAVDGASVLYANTQTDTDTVMKPTTDGVEADTVLRSVSSPGQLYIRVGLPPGASLVQAHGGTGSVKVMNDGQAIAFVRPPSATDAAGMSVPVSMDVKGDLLALTVSAQGEEYQWPVAVDPEVVIDHELGPAECYRGLEGEAEHKSSRWCVNEYPEKMFNSHWDSHEVELHTDNTVGDYIVVAYRTQGESKIYEVEAESGGNAEKGVAKLEIARNRAEGKEEGEDEVTPATVAEKTTWDTTKPTTLCAVSGCADTGGTSGNLAAFKLEQKETSSEDVSGALRNTHVYIAQEKGPEPSFSTEPEIEVEKGVKRLNALVGEHWLGPHSDTAFEVKAHDPGVGIAWGKITLGSWKLEEPIYEEGKCNGVQCNENYHTAVTYSPGMAEGEQSIDWYASNLAGRPCESCHGMESKTLHLVKVDAKPPYDLEVSGWPARREISASPHVLTVKATDGEASIKSSGIKSIAVSVDGGPESLVSNLSCTEVCTRGPTTGSGEYTLHAEALTEGVHRLVVTATDNADNVASEEFTFDVRHGSPVPVGPGTVDPTTGQFKLSATDVSLAGSGGVSRVYESRNVTAGAGGPLGPQWALSLGGGEGLTVLPTGSVVLASSAGGTTTFTPNEKEKGQFESPLGDGNVKIEAKEKEAGKGITEYLLKETTAGTTTTFTQPAGTELTAPVYSDQFGAEGAQLNDPESDAVDASGNVWVTDFQDGRIEKFSQAGVLLASYGSPGWGTGQFMDPWGIAVNQSTGNVYVTDQGNNRIVELNSSGEFVRAFGWNVNSRGKGEFEVCTSYCKAGTAGSEPGEVNIEAGVAIDSSGNVWVADYGNNRIEEFGEAGEYKQKFGVEGKGEVQFKGPLNIAFSGGKLYVTDNGNDRVEELSTAGKYEGQFGKEGTGSGEFKSPRGIAAESKTGNLYVTDAGNSRVQEFSPSGKLITKFGSAGSGAGQFSEPTGVVVGASGAVYATDYNNKRVQEWTRPSWLPERSESALKATTTSYAYKAVEEEGQTVIEPIEAVAPAPAGVTCTKSEEKVVGEALKAGCRALLFSYAEKTKSPIGEAPSEWGEYAGHLKTVSFEAENPSTKKMEEKPIPVAEYSYDSKGRLRAEWDPRISPALKTTYGYDAEGHVTAVTPPGQQLWALTYGTISGDPNTGRLLKITQSQPEAGATKGVILERLKEQSQLPRLFSEKNGPKLSGSTVVGVTMGVSAGIWHNSPVAYGYQWEDCNTAGAECAPILGATNANYKVASNDADHTLVAVVTATNGGGSISASTVASGLVGAAVC